MKIKNYNGNLLDSNATIIMHQVNCLGVMGSGVAKAIKEKWPIVFKDYVNFSKDVNSEDLLGLVQYVKINDDQYVANLFSQENFGYNGNRFTSYDAVDTCLKKVAIECKLNKITSVALPYKMSSDRGGADWDVILALICSAFKDTEVTIEIWKL